MEKKQKWNDYLWIASSVYLLLGFFNILFAWLGLLCFLIPLGISLFKGDKTYCNSYCGRSKLFELLGRKLKLSRNSKIPNFLKSNWFRYGFLTFFMAMFIQMLYTTYLVFGGMKTLADAITLLWTFNVPWNFAMTITVAPWISQFALGFYSVMLTSTILGFITMFLFKPRSWCVYCPMGTMTQGICYLKNKKEL